MRKYRAVIIDLKRIFQILLLMLLLAAVLFLIGKAGIKLLPENDFPKNIIKSSVPVISATDTDISIISDIKDFAKNMTLSILGFDVAENEFTAKAFVPIIAAVADNSLYNNARTKMPDIQTPKEVSELETELNIPEENQAPIKNVDLSQKLTNGGGAAIGNETSYTIDVDNMLSSLPDINMKGDGPKILITHTHATESYALPNVDIYDITASERNSDKSKNVVAVGKRMKEVFNSYGIEVIHDEILHDEPSFNGSYAHSLNTAEEYMKKYPSIQIVFDIHRDSIVYDDQTKARAVTEINGKRAAQLMFVVGTDENGLYHPNWRSNMKSALYFQRSITAEYPKLMRHINLRRERFNGHTSGASMIIETGTSGNSLEEAIYAIELATECIAKFLNENF